VAVSPAPRQILLVPGATMLPSPVTQGGAHFAPSALVPPAVPAVPAVPATPASLAAPIATRVEKHAATPGSAYGAPGAAPARRWRGDGSSLQSTIAWAEKCLREPDARGKAYLAFLHALGDWGLLEGLPLDSSGVLQVGLPFCGGCSEAPLLLSFLAERFLPFAGEGIFVRGCDVDADPAAYWWPAWEEWAAHVLGPRGLRLEVQQQDLAQALLPNAPGLILGVHPLVTGVDGEGPWRSILANVLASRAPGGRCIFATFYRSEAEKVQSMCQDLGVRCEIRESPHYASTPERTVATHLRFAAIVDVN